MYRLVKFWNVHFLGLELLFTIVLACAFAFWVFRLNGYTAVNSTLNGNRSTVYGALASISASLLGFVITALSIIIGYSTHEKFEFLRKTKHYHTLWDILIKTVKALSLATICMIVGLIFDRDGFSNNIILCICMYSAILTFFRLKRCIWVLEKVIGIIIA